MRLNHLFVILLATQFSATAAPRKVARRNPVARPKAAPLSPEKLRGQVIFIQGRDVWAISPTTRQKRLLFKELFTSARTSGTPQNEPDRNFTARDIAWSSDRQFIAYTSRESLDRNNSLDGSELFLMRWDGTQKRRLTNRNYQLIADKPQFSPDGKQLLYETSSLYRMGGPGYTQLRIHVLDLASKTDRAIGPPETSFDPKWSRDGKRVLFSYLNRNIDYKNEGPPPAQQTMLADGTDIQPYRDDWADYFGDNQSRIGQSRILRTPIGTSAIWEISSIGSSYLSTIWREDTGIVPSRFVWNDVINAKVMQARLNQWIIGKDGIARVLPEDNIWLLEKSTNTTRLLARNAQLIDWF